MRHLARHPFTLGVAVSLLLCVAAGLLWVRSAYRYDVISHESDRLPRVHWIRYSFESTPGRLSFAYEAFELTQAPASPIPDRGWHYQSGRYRTNLSIISDVPAAESAFSHEFHYQNTRSPTTVKGIPGTYAFRSVEFPDWVLVMLFIVLPAAAAVRHYRQRRGSQTGRCVRCGYDLRASPDRCPECGTPAK